ncbi:MAG: 2-isopropylmalate synthase, partial [Helicobacter sp.]|nr:2-isopropylmalate synthase [Helicobacter sp.]
MESVIIFDTTLRDGEQSPGASMTTEEKIKIALGLERLGVDVIEAGFAASSPGDFEAIAQIATLVQKSTVCSLARAVPSDIEAAAKAIAKAPKRRIHTFIATSPIHMEYKLKLTPDKVIAKAIEAVRLAKSFTDDVEFSCEDASRSEMPFLKEILSAVVEAGATTLNLPDTVGYRFPNEIGAMIAELAKFIGNKAILSVHCHNDLGQATANAVYGILNGARQVECTINGLGERAGNTALEEVAMILKTRKDLFANLTTNINTQEIYGISKLVADITGIRPQPNNAIVGKNAFAHESGIHQDGVLKNPETYEIMRPSDIGIPENNGLVLGKHSGRAAFKDKIL